MNNIGDVICRRQVSEGDKEVGLDFGVGREEVPPGLSTAKTGSFPRIKIRETNGSVRHCNLMTIYMLSYWFNAVAGNLFDALVVFWKQLRIDNDDGRMFYWPLTYHYHNWLLSCLCDHLDIYIYRYIYIYTLCPGNRVTTALTTWPHQPTGGQHFATISARCQLTSPVGSFGAHLIRSRWWHRLAVKRQTAELYSPGSRCRPGAGAGQVPARCAATLVW